MKVTIYELFGMIKDGKAPKKIIIDGGIYNLRTGKGTSYEFGSSGAMLCFDYYIENNKLDTIVEVIEEQKEDKEIEKLEYIENGDFIEVPSNQELMSKINEIIDKINGGTNGE